MLNDRYAVLLKVGVVADAGLHEEFGGVERSEDSTTSLAAPTRWGLPPWMNSTPVTVEPFITSLVTNAFGRTARLGRVRYG